MSESAAFIAQCFSWIWTIAAREAEADGVDLSRTIGLARADLVLLALRWSPAPDARALALAACEKSVFDDEEEQLVALLDAHRADDSQEAFWLARMIARRAMRPNHLWQDLGLPERAAVSRLLREKFPRLAGRNVNNMKWKKFFYRCLCEMEGFHLCTAPSCPECGDFDACFGPEDGESLLARIRRGDLPETLSHP
jgi:nitrogen fixation protein NifQ